MAYLLSVFAENKPGRIERVTKVLAEADVDIRNINIASAGDFGVIHLLVNDPEKGYEKLKGAGIPVSRKEIVAVYMEDRPGGLHSITRVLSENEINVEDASGFILRDRQEAVFIFHIKEFALVSSVLEQAGFKILPDEEIYSL